MLKRIRLSAIMGLMLTLLTGCGSTPVFHAEPQGTVGARGHIQTRIELDSRRFSVRSGGEIVGARESLRSEAWQRIGEFSTSHFVIAYFAPETEAVLFDSVLSAQVDIVSGERRLSDFEILRLGFVRLNDALLEMLGTRVVKSRFNLYYSRPDAPARVPFTDWQAGPLVDPVELNLAALMPIRADGQSRVKPEVRTAWQHGVVSAFSHEYMHVVQQNAPTPPRSALADEFVAHTTSDCTSMILRGNMSEASRSSGMEVAKEYFQKGKRHYLDQPFALSDSAGDLAILAVSLLYSRPELKDATLAEWQRIAPAYCKYIANSVPDFSTVNGALDWIDKHVYRAKLDFLSSNAQK